MVSQRRTEDGGAVAAYSDITELKQREQESDREIRGAGGVVIQAGQVLGAAGLRFDLHRQQDVKIVSKRKKLTVCLLPTSSVSPKSLTKWSSRTSPSSSTTI